MNIRFLLLTVLCMTTSACSVRHTAYTASGAALGAGIGYSYNHNDKEAAIGGLAGGVAGAVLGEVEHRSNKRQYTSGYQEGYGQARVDLAQDYWDQTTGKGSAQSSRSMNLRKFKVPARNEDGVKYESYYVVLEDYR